MNNTILREILTSFYYLVQDSTPFEGVILLGVLLKVATITIFCDEIAMVVGIVNIYEFDKVRMVKFLDDFYLVVE